MKYPWLSSPLQYQGWFDLPSKSFVTRSVDNVTGVSTPPVTPHPSDNSSSPPSVNNDCDEPLKATGKTKFESGQNYRQYVDCLGNYLWYRDTIVSQEDEE